MSLSKCQALLLGKANLVVKKKQISLRLGLLHSLIVLHLLGHQSDVNLVLMILSALLTTIKTLLVCWPISVNSMLIRDLHSYIAITNCVLPKHPFFLRRALDSHSHEEKAAIAE